MRRSSVEHFHSSIHDRDQRYYADGEDAFSMRRELAPINKVSRWRQLSEIDAYSSSSSSSRENAQSTWRCLGYFLSWRDFYSLCVCVCLSNQETRLFSSLSLSLAPFHFQFDRGTKWPSSNDRSEPEAHLTFHLRDEP